jgi:hypothetical protein
LTFTNIKIKILKIKISSVLCLGARLILSQCVKNINEKLLIISGPKWNEVAERQRKVSNEELRNLQPSQIAV